MVSRFHSLIGCHPPLISSRTEGMCSLAFNLSQSDQNVKTVLETIDNLSTDYKSTVCKKPCTSYNFHTRLMYSFTKNRTENAIKLVFDTEMDITNTYFLMKFPSLLTGLGGAISGGRTFFWLIISIVGLFRVLNSFK